MVYTGVSRWNVPAILPAILDTMPPVPSPCLSMSCRPSHHFTYLPLITSSDTYINGTCHLYCFHAWSAPGRRWFHGDNSGQFIFFYWLSWFLMTILIEICYPWLASWSLWKSWDQTCSCSAHPRVVPGLAYRWLSLRWKWWPYPEECWTTCSQEVHQDYRWSSYWKAVSAVVSHGVSLCWSWWTRSTPPCSHCLSGSWCWSCHNMGSSLKGCWGKVLWICHYWRCTVQGMIYSRYLLTSADILLGWWYDYGQSRCWWRQSPKYQLQGYWITEQRQSSWKFVVWICSFTIMRHYRAFLIHSVNL